MVLEGLEKVLEVCLGISGGGWDPVGVQWGHQLVADE